MPSNIRRHSLYLCILGALSPTPASGVGVHRSLHQHEAKARLHGALQTPHPGRETVKDFR